MILAQASTDGPHVNQQEDWIFDPGDNVFPQPFKARLPEWISFNYICKLMPFLKYVHCCVQCTQQSLSLFELCLCAGVLPSYPVSN